MYRLNLPFSMLLCTQVLLNISAIILRKTLRGHCGHLVFRDLLTITINLAQSQKNALVIFLGDSSHSGVHVAQKKEANCGENHYEFSNPEGRVPAVLFSNRVEGESCHKSSDCRKKGEMVKVQSFLEGLTVVTYRLPSVPQLHETSHRNLKVRFRWL